MPHDIRKDRPGWWSCAPDRNFCAKGLRSAILSSRLLTILGTDTANAEATLRALYADQTAPIFVLVKDALMVKYASNAFHALKIAFANEIAAVCQQAAVDAEAVMDVGNDNKLNISRRYLMPGFAFGGLRLPKDVRAVLHAGNSLDLHLPVIAAILSSNDYVIRRAFDQVQATGKRRIGMIGLSFKSNTDDRREVRRRISRALAGQGIRIADLRSERVPQPLDRREQGIHRRRHPAPVAAPGAVHSMNWRPSTFAEATSFQASPN